MFYQAVVVACYLILTFLNIGEGSQNCFHMVLNVGSISKGTNQTLTRASGMLVSSTIMLLIEVSRYCTIKVEMG